MRPERQGWRIRSAKGGGAGASGDAGRVRPCYGSEARLSRSHHGEEEALDQDERVDTLAGLALFGDLGPAQLAEAAHTFSEESYPAGQRILRQGFTGSGFFVILEGEVAVRIDGEDRARLGKGDFFGEMSLLLGEPPVADVVALGPLRLMHLAGVDLKGFLVRHPSVMYRMLQTVARRLRNANRWRG